MENNRALNCFRSSSLFDAPETEAFALQLQQKSWILLEVVTKHEHVTVCLPGKYHKLVDLLIRRCFSAVPNKHLQVLQLPGVLIRCVTKQSERVSSP